MSEYTVVVRLRTGLADHHGASIKKEAAAAGLKGVKAVRVGQAYRLAGVSEAGARALAEKLLADPVTQAADVVEAGRERPPAGARQAQVWPKGGVSDPVADTVRLAARDLKVGGLAAVRSGRVYDFVGTARAAEVKRFCEDHLMNALVQKVDVL